MTTDTSSDRSRADRPDASTTGSTDDDRTAASTVERLESWCRTVTAINGVPISPGNRLDVLRNGDQIFPAMLEAIDAADRSIDLLTYVYWAGEIGATFAERLAQRARDGVRVRVLLDGVGAKPIDQENVELMRSGGADVRYFRPLDPRHPFRASHRTHRKVMICDEAVGFTGGVGIADQWMGDGRSEGNWRDTHVRLQGPGVAGLRSAFLDNWIETEQVLFESAFDHFPAHEHHGNVPVQIIKGTAEPGWNDISMTVRALIELADEQIRLTSAYFVPDEDLILRLCRAAERGVDVQILLPGPGADKRFVQLAGEAVYDRLLDHGIKIWCYQPSMLHAKIMTLDGLVTLIGSANFNQRSTSLDEEVDIVAFDRDVTAELDADFDADLERSEKIDPARWRSRWAGQQAFERAANLIRPWM
ncbi:MAG: cardiolipin synthase B [Acidimicrobiaceae bacterium]|nr:cardiolipin synthase B [Acidimicrobiaceae bacterium]